MNIKPLAIPLFLILSTVQASADEKPNFVFFLSDDQLKADYGCYGLPVDLAPTVDQSGANYTCPQLLIGTVAKFDDPHQLTDSTKR